MSSGASEKPGARAASATRRGPYLASPRPHPTRNDTFRHDGADDEDFDARYPERLRVASRMFWTPLAVARRAAELFASHGARRVLDVGSGPGKFCLGAAAREPSLSFTGIEHRDELVAIATTLAEQLGLPNVRFEKGEATASDWGAHDGLYFFNPFGENLFGDPSEFLDDTVELSCRRFQRDVERTESQLIAAAVGTVVATYHGYGGRVPCSYELVEAERCGTNWLRVWVKREEGNPSQSGWRELYYGGVRRTRFFTEQECEPDDPQPA
jgi:predicted RNA methylase